MSTLPFEKFSFPVRKVAFTQYVGPRHGLANATKSIYAWVGTYFAERMADVTLCYAERATPDSLGDPDARIEVEIQFELDDFVPMDSKLPPDMAIKLLLPETLLMHTYHGPLTGMRAAMLPWITDMAEHFAVAPGYRQRIIKQGENPADPNWEIELQLVMAPKS